MWRNEFLREKLLLAASVAESKGLSALRKVVKQVTRTNGFVEYREAGNYANRLEDLAALLSQRIEEGPPELIDVIEEAIAQAEDAMQHVDDSNGEVMSAILDLRNTHLAACNALRRRALDFLWQKVAEEEASDGLVRRSPWDKPRRGDIVSILLREGAVEAMWDAFSGGRGDVGLWEPVADARGAWTTRL